MSAKVANLVENNFAHIKKKLLQFGGGRVFLSKNETTRIATILLDHPEKQNAMSGQMLVEFRDTVEALEEWEDGKAVILTGKGGNFCSGGDLAAEALGTAQMGLDVSTWMQDALRRLQRLPLVSVCLVHGPSFGGGAEMSIFCDFLVAAENVKFAFLHGKMGVTTAFGGGTELVNRIGKRKALDLLLTAKVLTATECVDIGLAETVVPTENALVKTVEWLTPRLQHHHSITRAMKKITSNAALCALEDAFRFEKFTFAPLWGGEVNREALRKIIDHDRKSKM